MAPYATFAVARGRRRTDGQEGRQGAGGTPRLPGLTGVAGTRSWRDVSCGTGSGPCRVRETDSARRGGCRMAGGPDVARHAAAAACDGKGIRVDGQYRTTVRGPATLTGTGSPIKTQHHRPRPLSRPRGATSPSRSEPAERTAAHVRHGSIWRIANNVRVDPRGRRPWRRNPNSRAPSGEDDAPTALRPAPEAGRRRLARHAPGLPHQSARPCR